MEFLFELLMEIVFEVFVEGFVGLYSVFVPQKALSAKGRKIVQVVCGLLAVLLLIGLVIGLIILDESGGQSVWGWVMVGAGAVYLLAGITLKIVFCIKA